MTPVSRFRAMGYASAMGERTKIELPSLLTSLSARLLVLTVLFVMLAEVMIWAPSVARYRKSYLEDYVARAYLSMLAVDVMPGKQLGKELQEALLFHTDAHAIVLNRPDKRMLMVGTDMPPEVDMTFDLRGETFFGYLGKAMMALTRTEDRVIRVVGMPPKNPDVTVEVLLDEAPMRAAMIDYSTRILTLSIIISLFAATLVYFSLQWLMVRPMRRISRSMARFRAHPEAVQPPLAQRGRSDEIGIAQRELAVMQEELRTALRQQSRLAALGAAVAKVNHDLRNSLATAVLVSDRLATIDDPDVKRVLPRLYNAIDRAVELCSQTLKYVSDAEPVSQPEDIALADVVDEAMRAFAADAADGGEATGEWRIEMPRALQVHVDRRQLLRVLTNLGRNAFEAGATCVTVTGAPHQGRVLVEVADDGPGLPERAKEKLFQPFAGSARNGGTGLGLVIVHDVIKAHGGEIELAASGPEGTTFRFTLPPAGWDDHD